MPDPIVNICTKIAQVLLPPVCQLCGGAGLGPDICAGCFRDLPRVSRPCGLCARPVQPGAGSGICGRCLGRPPRWEAAVAPLRYTFPVDRLLLDLKYRGRLIRARLLGELLGHWARGRRDRIDVLMPVPLHRRRWRQRGFNQARELAVAVARASRLDLIEDGCSRVKDTPPLWDHPAAERRRILSGAFRVGAAVAGRRIALIDDVLTTGTTAAALTAAMLEAGARRIEIWAVARAGIDQTGSNT